MSSQTLLLLLRLALAAVFAVAAAGKLADLSGSRAAVAGFGVPARFAGAVGTLLPIAELSLAVLLVLDSTARPAAFAATLLLFGFLAGIVRVMARREQAECHCFGALHSAPVGRGTLARNAVLIALAVGVALGGRGSQASGWIARLHGTGALAAGEAVALLGVLIASGSFALALLRRHGALLLRIDDLEERLAGGSAPLTIRTAPGFTAGGLHGETVTLESLLARGVPLLMLFTDPVCGPCNALMPEVARWQSEHVGAISFALISGGSIEQNRAKADEHGVSGVYLQEGRMISEKYGVTGTPSAVLVRPDGQISAPLATGAEEIRALVARVATGQLAQVIDVRPHLPPAPAPPAPAPPVPQAIPAGAAVPRRRLTDLRGRDVNLAPGGGQTMVLFWNPQCGFCEQLEPELVLWERERRNTDPRLVLVSAGPEDANRALPFRAPVVFDPDSAVTQEFGAIGTPSALLIDGRGRVVSDLAVGGPAVLELAGASTVEAVRA